MTIQSSFEQEHARLRIAVAGRFDFSCHESFRSAYEEQEELCAQFVVDLSETEYLDSSALGMLLLLRDHGGGDDAKIQIVGCNETVRKAFAISNFDQLFDIH